MLSFSYLKSALFGETSETQSTEEPQSDVIMQDVLEESPLETNLNHDDLQKLLGHLSLTDATNLFLKLPSEMVVKSFVHLKDDFQNHIFPLLDDSSREQVFQQVTENKQHTFLEHLSGFQQRKEESENNINHPDSFFYWMAVWNAKKAQHRNKTTFVATAANLIRFDIKPFKYQRKLMERHVQCIADGIQQSGIMFHPIIMSYIKSRGTLTIVDGQHRWNAIRRLPQALLDNLQVQIDVIKFPDNDEEIMKYYKYINTNVPIDQTQLQKELDYVALIDKIKQDFPGSIQTYSKSVSQNQSVPQHFVIDSWLKEELQYRDILNKMQPETVVTKLHEINQQFANDTELLKSLTAIETRMCKRSIMFLGVNWPKCIDMLESQ